MTNSNQEFANKLYECVLSSKQEPKCILKALDHILRLAFEDSRHFVFLLDRVPWFEAPYLLFIHVLEKTIRLYRGQGKQATEVGYNILADGLRRPQTFETAVQSIHSLAEGRWDWQIIMKSLRKNYPHKVCALMDHETYVEALIVMAKKFPGHHVDIMGLIMQNLVLMDTEMLEGDQYMSEPFPPELKIKELRYRDSELKSKYDCLLVKMLEYLGQIREEEFLLKEMFMVFQQKLLLADKTKMIQYVLFYLAESSKKSAAMFVSLLLGNVLDFNFKTTNQAYINSTFYLSSYVIRTTHFTTKSILKVIKTIIQHITPILNLMVSPINYQTVYLKTLKQANIRILHLLQSLLHILAYYPQLRTNIQQIYTDFINLAHQKLYFQAFINPQITKRLGIQFHYQGQMIRMQNKFNPVILPKTSQKIDVIYKFYESEGPKRALEIYDKLHGMPYKKMKIGNDGSTPVSIVSCQESTCHKY